MQTLEELQTGVYLLFCIVTDRTSIDKNGIGKWVDLTGITKSKVSQVVSGDLNEDGQIDISDVNGIINLMLGK